MHKSIQVRDRMQWTNMVTTMTELIIPSPYKILWNPFRPRKQTMGTSLKRLVFHFFLRSMKCLFYLTCSIDTSTGGRTSYSKDATTMSPQNPTENKNLGQCNCVSGFVPRSWSWSVFYPDVKSIINNWLSKWLTF